MLKDKMTPMERAIAISKGNTIDRIQCNPNTFQWYCKGSRIKNY